MIKSVILILLNYDNSKSSYLEVKQSWINTTSGRNMLKVTILASFFVLALALQHAESCSSSPDDQPSSTSQPPSTSQTPSNLTTGKYGLCYA